MQPASLAPEPAGISIILELVAAGITPHRTSAGGKGSPVRAREPDLNIIALVLKV